MPSWSPRVLNSSSRTTDQTPDVFLSHNESLHNNDECHLERLVGAGAYFSVAASSSPSECFHQLQHPQSGRSSCPHLLPSPANDDGTTKARGGNLNDCGLNELRSLPAITISAPFRTTPSQPANDGLMTGNCTTCGPLVRWPRHLQVFRRTVCLDVNQLKLASAKPTDEDGLEAEFHVNMDKTQTRNQKLVMQRAGTILSLFKSLSP